VLYVHLFLPVFCITLVIFETVLIGTFILKQHIYALLFIDIPFCTKCVHTYSVRDSFYVWELLVSSIFFILRRTYLMTSVTLLCLLVLITCLWSLNERYNFMIAQEIFYFLKAKYINNIYMNVVYICSTDTGLMSESWKKKSGTCNYYTMFAIIALISCFLVSVTRHFI